MAEITSSLLKAGMAFYASFETKVMNREEISQKYEVLDVDYSAPGIPPGVKDLQPLVYKDGDFICVMSGETSTEEVFGRGHTIEEALQDFQEQYEGSKQNSF